MGDTGVWVTAFAMFLCAAGFYGFHHICLNAGLKKWVSPVWALLTLLLCAAMTWYFYESMRGWSLSSLMLPLVAIVLFVLGGTRICGSCGVTTFEQEYQSISKRETFCRHCGEDY